MKVGDYVLYLGWRMVEIAQIERVTAKQVRLKDNWRGRTKRMSEIVASFPDAASAERLRDALNGAIGQRESRIRKARDEFEGRRAAAFAAYEKIERRLLASAGEAGTAETTKIGSVHEHAVGSEADETPKDNPND